MTPPEKNADRDDKTGAWAMFQLVEALLTVAETHAAHAATSPAAPAWRQLAAACHEILGDDNRADELRAVPQPSPFAYGDAPRFMAPGPEPTPGIPASARDEAKRNR